MVSSLFGAVRGTAASRARALSSALLFALLCWLLGSTGVAHADRWGPPWQGRVTTDYSSVYSQPDWTSPTVGPLWRDALVVVLEERLGTDGDAWLQIPDGFVRAAVVDEVFEPWLAQVSVPSVSMYAKPFVASGVMRAAREGDLVRVTGVSRGLEGDTGLWWVTTQGYAPLGTLRWATEDWAHWWQMPRGEEATGGWWGTLVSQATVRAAPTTESPAVGTFSGGENVKVLAEEQGESLEGNSLWYRIDGGRFAGARVHSSRVRRMPDPKPNMAPPVDGATSAGWIVVDKSASTLTFAKDGKPQFVTYASLGLAGVATPSGTYTTFGKFVGDRMSSNHVVAPLRPYDLPNVPYTQYYKEGGYAIHGTYWHDLFGTRESQGCINLTWTDAAYLFSVTSPGVPDGVVEAWDLDGTATPLVIVD